MTDYAKHAEVGRQFDVGPGFVRAKECPDCGHTRCGESCVCNCDAARAEYDLAAAKAEIARLSTELEEALEQSSDNGAHAAEGRHLSRAHIFELLLRERAAACAEGFERGRDIGMESTMERLESMQKYERALGRQHEAKIAECAAAKAEIERLKAENAVLAFDAIEASK
jgi:hypothetical protein